MAKIKLKSDDIVKYLMEDLRGYYPLDFPVGKWGEKFAQQACESIWGAGRKGAEQTIIKKLEKALSEYPSHVVSNEFAVDYVIGHIYNKL